VQVYYCDKPAGSETCEAETGKKGQIRDPITGKCRYPGGEKPPERCPNGAEKHPIWGCNQPPSLCPPGTVPNDLLIKLGVEWPYYCVPDIEFGFRTSCGDGTYADEYPDKKCPPKKSKVDCGDGTYSDEYIGGECPEKPVGKCREDEVQDGNMCYGTCPDNSTYSRTTDGDYPCSGRGGDGDEGDSGKGGEQPECPFGAYFDTVYNRCIATICLDDSGRSYTPSEFEKWYGCGSKGSQDMASGGIVKKTKKYQTGGIASLPARDPRMGGAMNPADGYNFGFAQGGMPSMPEYQAGGKLLRGPGDGMSDDIPAVIRGKGVQRAALADGEFVIPADVVSHLGNGSTEAGAKKLYKMMEQIRRARTGTGKQAPQVNPDKFLPRVTPAKKRRRG
jgi:hypothetical protein